MTEQADTVTLEPIMIRDIENIVLSKQLADAEAKLAQASMAEATRKMQQAVAAEAAIVAQLERQVGRKLSGKIELLDRDKGLCRLT
jgi:hypothetical protein